MIQQAILDSNSNASKVGWAFGIGLDRIAMVLYDIPDIRLFWSKDPRFCSQFSKKAAKSTINKTNKGAGLKFVPFSKYPACYKDISFWIPPNWHENDFMEVCRDVCGDLAEEVRIRSELDLY